MARFGAQYPCFKAASGTAGIVLGKLVSANMRINKANAELYADDGLAESDYSPLSVQVDVELDDMTDEIASELFGQTLSQSGELSVTTEDAAPIGVLGYYTVHRRGGVRKYVARVYTNAQAQPGDENAQTKGSSTSFQTRSVSFICMPDESDGEIYKQKTCDTAADAKTFIQTKCGIA